MAQQFVDGKISGNKVVVFLKPTCPYCVTAKQVLSKYNIKNGHLEFVDISNLPDMSSIQDYLMKKTGARTVPRVFIGEECIGGGSDVDQLDRRGELEGRLQAIGALN
ncbi:glutaredoxin-1 [Polypterus senegalus]|nr:glutaredoxin-1 [Polypterus senegalus]XP_039615311.1 glutaredoxin-1 [Polypterus senegalus]